MNLRNAFSWLKPTYDGPPSWLWFVGLARIGVLLLGAAGVNLVVDLSDFSYFLTLIYTAAFASSVWYLFELRRDEYASAIITWTQMLVDFCVVAATLSFTGGQQSFFTFLLVIVILEAGVLLGLMHGFLFSLLSSAFMFFHFAFDHYAITDPFTHWYNFLIQSIAFFFTAFISGYWNQRVSRMKQFQREILDNMNSGFLIADTKAIVTAINNAGCQMLDVLPGAVAGLHVEGVMRPASREECPVVTALRAQKDFTSYEFYVRTMRDKKKLIGLTTNRLRDPRGRVTGIIVSFTDLTEIARMRQELQQQDRMAAIGEQLAGLAHEIRNPVAAIRSAVEELHRNADNPEMARRLAAIAKRESDHLSDIVSGFLDFARDPAKRKAAVDVSKLLREISDTFRARYGGDGRIEVQETIPEGPACYTIGDRTQLHEVFTNIAMNAVEAMDGKGALSISVVPPHEGQVPIEIRIEDEGPGIAPDKVARIFEPFFTEKVRGVGMGLAICMRIVTAHDGTIQAAARPEGGTAMIVRLPVAKGVLAKMNRSA